jgi:hypothetical protein
VEGYLSDPRDVACTSFEISEAEDLVGGDGMKTG